ncbi:MAG: HDOD domain-containing protein [Deltaproteobacteria bacterium]|nr:HDOD domain-containing protein [Deltaproteobacteria bacterium]
MDIEQLTRTRQDAFAGPNRVYIARQAIYDRDLNACAYELLYRSSATATQASLTTGDLADASRDTIVGAICEIGLERLAGNLPCFINVEEHVLTSRACLHLPKDRIVIEILENVSPTRTVFERIEELIDAGFRIALDDFVDSRAWAPIAKIAHIIKVDILHRSLDEISAFHNRLERYPGALLAEKVETHAQLNHCRALGFHYFQGFFLCRPDTIEGNRVPEVRLQQIRLLAEIQGPNRSFEELERTVRADPGLSIKLLRFLNSAAVALPHRVESLRQALVFAGIHRLRAWLSFFVMSRLSSASGELLRLTMVRARMCELLAQAKRRSDDDAFFTVGLLSTMDALAGQPMDDLLEKLPLSEAMNLALRDHSGDLGAALSCAIAFERADWSQVMCSTLDPSTISAAYLEAVRWAESTEQELADG